MCLATPSKIDCELFRTNRIIAYRVKVPLFEKIILIRWNETRHSVNRRLLDKRKRLEGAIIAAFARRGGAAKTADHWGTPKSHRLAPNSVWLLNFPPNQHPLGERAVRVNSRGCLLYKIVRGAHLHCSPNCKSWWCLSWCGSISIRGT
ncbi:hypothetical protein CEXT_382401 [Caerostris extrusa]|uniref:Uncharacterized protein n=1 Tax=Caerostris extrusa TaxID=172846 RepID=A0AAV4PIH4_CAEEX|nr:hypothetical protein CEXT_382401 [Caerostris extrusa]